MNPLPNLRNQLDALLSLWIDQGGDGCDFVRESATFLHGFIAGQPRFARRQVMLAVAIAALADPSPVGAST